MSSPSPSSTPRGTKSTTRQAQANAVAKLLPDLIRVHKAVCDLQRGGSLDVTIQTTAGPQVVTLDRKGMDGWISEYAKAIRALGKAKETSVCARLVSSFSNPIIVDDNMRNFIAQYILSHPRARNDIGDELIGELDVTVGGGNKTPTGGVTSQTILNLLFTMYSYWENLPSLASSNRGKQPTSSDYKYDRYGSTPPLATLFNSYMGAIQTKKSGNEFDVMNFRISDRPKVFSAARDSGKEAGLPVNKDGMARYRLLVEQACEAQLASQGINNTSKDAKKYLNIDYNVLGQQAGVPLRGRLDQLRVSLEKRNVLLRDAATAARPTRAKKPRSPRRA